MDWERMDGGGDADDEAGLARMEKAEKGDVDGKAFL